jgi:GNAT superfamily N-acetyltransferase
MNIISLRDFPQKKFERFAIDYLSPHWKKDKDWIRDNFVYPARETDSFPFLFIAHNHTGDPLGMIILFLEKNGYLGIQNQPWITGLYVISSERKKGIGTSLIEHAKQEAQHQGYRFLYLDTASMKDFYTTKNWKTVGKALWEEGNTYVTVMKTQLDSF